MNDDFEFLEYIYDNAKIGQETVGRIINIKTNKDSSDEILREIIENYKKISMSAKLMIERRKKEAKEVSILSKMATYMSVKKNLEQNDCPEEIIRILKQNISSSIDEIDKKQKESKLKSKTIINLANRFIEIEKDNLEKIKQINLINN